MGNNQISSISSEKDPGVTNCIWSVMSQCYRKKLNIVGCINVHVICQGLSSRGTRSTRKGHRGYVGRGEWSVPRGMALDLPWGIPTFLPRGGGEVHQAPLAPCSIPQCLPTPNPAYYPDWPLCCLHQPIADGKETPLCGCMWGEELTCSGHCCHPPPCTTTSQKQGWGGARAVVPLCRLHRCHPGGQIGGRELRCGSSHHRYCHPPPHTTAHHPVLFSHGWFLVWLCRLLMGGMWLARSKACQ